MEQNDVRKIFSRNLRYYMAREKKLQTDMAEYMDVSSATASDWYNGKKVPRADKMQKLSEWLGITMGQLMDSKDPYGQDQIVTTREAVELAMRIFRDERCHKIVDMLTRLDDDSLIAVEAIVKQLSRWPGERN